MVTTSYNYRMMKPVIYFLYTQVNPISTKNARKFDVFSSSQKRTENNSKYRQKKFLCFCIYCSLPSSHVPPAKKTSGPFLLWRVGGRDTKVEGNKVINVRMIPNDNKIGRPSRRSHRRKRRKREKKNSRRRYKARRKDEVEWK